MSDLQFYFAYGSNMSTARLQARIPEARVHGTAKLNGYRLAFHKQSNKDGSAKCDAFCTGMPQDLIWGVVYHIPAAAWPILDAIEGTGLGYERESLEVDLAGASTLRVHLYVATLINDGLKPMDWYKHHVLQGAREHRLPSDYIDSIAAVAEQVDDNADRRQRELSLHSAP